MLNKRLIAPRWAVVAALAGLAFGAIDQYLGSLRPMVALGPWTASVSQMSTLWLLLPFALGCTQDRTRDAIAIGLISILGALIGYFAMTLSPVEGVTLRRAAATVPGLLRSNAAIVVGGLVTGPLFGLLGHRWRAAGSWTGPAVIAGAFLLEPAARALDGQLPGPSWIWVGEAILGACLVTMLAVRGVRGRASKSSDPDVAS